MSVYNANDKVLTLAWDQVNPNSTQYVKMDVIQKWTAIVLQQSNTMQHLNSQSRIQGLLSQYLVEECEIGEVATNVQFKYEEALDFINWLTAQNETDPIELNNSKNSRMYHHKGELKGNSKYQETLENKGNGKLKDQQMHQQNTKAGFEHSPKEQDAQPQQEQIQGQKSVGEIQNEEYENKVQVGQNNSNLNNMTNNSNLKSSKLTDRQSRMRKHSGDINESRVILKSDELVQSRPISQNKGRLDNFGRHDAKEVSVIKQSQQMSHHNWNQYIRIIFQHYCKLTYAMGQDPTFDQIQHKSQTMTVNKFMIFCRDFAILKLPNVTRAVLVDAFKKNSECYKEMNLEQFKNVLQKIAKTTSISAEYQTNQQQNGKTERSEKSGGENQKDEKQPSKDMIFMLKYLQVDGHVNFKEKMKKIGIKNFQIRGKGVSQHNSNINAKKQPFNYKFKFQPAQKSTQQIKKEVIQRRNIRSEKKLKPKQNAPNPGVVSKKRVDMTPDLHPRKAVDYPQALPPAIPPPKKMRESQLMSILQSSKFNNGITGYANIHRLKNNKFDHSQKRSRGEGSRGEHKLKLNSIVEEAKKIVDMNRDLLSRQNERQRSQTDLYNREDRHSSKYIRVRDSGGNYRLVHETQRSNAGTSYQQEHEPKHTFQSRRINNQLGYLQKPRMQLPTDQYSKDELIGLIGDQENDDEDQYLKEHLTRERRLDHIAQRLNKRIQELDRDAPGDN